MVKKNRILSFVLIIFAFAALIGLTIKDIVSDVKLGLDLQGGFEVLYEVSPLNEGDQINSNTLASTADALDRRINALGVSEPRIEIEEGNRIRVQLAGVEDQQQARKMLSTTAELTFRDANDKELLNGSDLVEGGAKQAFDQTNRPIVTLQLKDADKFAEATKHVLQQSNNVMVIWLDFNENEDSFAKEMTKTNPKYISAPAVTEVIRSTEVQITGDFTVEEAQNLANLLNAGSLPVKLTEIYSTSVGAQFGVDALQKTVFAGIIGIAAIFLFMLFYYRLPGLVAVIALTVYIWLILFVYEGLNAVLTLPGIAALVLGIGMAVDANIISYERLKEELRVGRSLQAAFKEANKSSFITIFDAQITTLIAAIVLYVYGESSIKGFATMLIVSILLSFITNVYVSRFLLGFLVHSRLFDGKLRLFGVKPSEVHELKEGLETTELTTKFDKIDFVKHKSKYFTASGALLLAGLVLLIIFKLNLSIDFTSGTRIEIMSDSEITTEEVKNELAKFDVETDDIVISGEDHDRATARYKGTLEQDEINDMKAYFLDKYGVDPNISVVTPTVGKEIAKNGMTAVAIAFVGIIIYVALRFEWRMGLAAVLALIHDAFFMVAVFSITRLEVDLNFIAAVLTVIGFSINDTIVTFDRMRDHLRKHKKIREYHVLEEIVNKSLRQVMTRSINTSLSTLLPVVFLLLFGSEAITNFSLAMFIGLVVGVYSSIFIAAQFWLVWKGKELKKKGVLITYTEKKKFAGDEPQV